MKGLIFIVFISVAFQVTAQHSPYIDSMLQKTAIVKSDTEKVNLYLKIGDAYLSDNLKSADEFYRKAGALSKKTGFVNGQLHYYLSISKSLSRQGYMDSALYSDLEALEWGESVKDSIIYAQLLLNLGTTYLQLDELEEAVKYIQQSKSIFFRLHNTEFDGKIYDLLQSLERIRHQYRKAVEYGLQAVKELERTGDSLKLCYAYNNLGLNYIELNSYDSAAYFLKCAYDLARNTNDLLIQITYNLNLGYINLLKGNFDKMKPYAEKALALSQKSKMSEYEGLALYGLANYYLAKKEYPQAKTYADSALHIAYRYNIRSLRLGVLPLLTNIVYAMQDTKSGFSLWAQYQSLNDSVLNESVTKNTIQTEKKYETEKKESQIKFQNIRIKQQTTLNYFLIAGTIAMLLISLLAYRNYMHRQKLQQQRISELETEKQLTATEAIIKGEEQERTRLAKDLHDGLGGMLSGIKYTLSNMKENMIMAPHDVQAFEHSILMLDNSINEMRRVAHNLMPEALLKFGLDDALNDFCKEVSSSEMPKIIYQSFGLKNKTIERSLCVTTYRIVQELLNNIIKHANATKAIVQVSASETQLFITVEDDGKGLTEHKLNSAHGIGWKNIQSRVDYHKGTLNMQTAKEKGTSVFIEFPLV